MNMIRFVLRENRESTWNSYKLRHTLGLRILKFCIISKIGDKFDSDYV